MRRGIAYWETSERDAAEREFRSALGLARSAGDARLAARALHEIGLVYSRYGSDEVRARPYFDEALAIARRIGAADLEAAVHNSAGNLFRDAPAGYARALRHYREGLAIAVRINDRVRQASSSRTPDACCGSWEIARRPKRIFSKRSERRTR